MDKCEKLTRVVDADLDRSSGELFVVQIGDEKRVEN